MRKDIFGSRAYYKPFIFPQFYEAYKRQNEIHWIPEEISLADDVKDWNSKLSKEEKNLLSQIFKFFTQADIDIASGYNNKYIPCFKHPEIRMMLNTFAAMEAIHIDAYSLLIETIGMPESSYKAFQDYEEMQDKHTYLKEAGKDLWAGPLFYKEGVEVENEWKYSPDFIRDILKTIAVYSAFGEGLQLFASFAILLNFSRTGKMKGMGQIVTFSIRDESLHVEAMIQIFREIVKEHKEIWTDEFKAEIYQIARDMVELEDKFIDLAFNQGGIEGLTSEDTKEYIRYIADRRLLQLGLKPNFKVKDNPLPWLADMLSSVEHTNFFENRVTSYAKGALKGSFEKDVWGKYKD